MPIFEAKHLKTISTKARYFTGSLWCQLVNYTSLTEAGVLVSLYSLTNLFIQSFIHREGFVL